MFAESYQYSHRLIPNQTISDSSNRRSVVVTHVAQSRSLCKQKPSSPFRKYEFRFPEGTCSDSFFVVTVTLRIAGFRLYSRIFREN